VYDLCARCVPGFYLGYRLPGLCVVCSEGVPVVVYFDDGDKEQKSNFGLE
jgi:hypothetical protein